MTKRKSSLKAVAKQFVLGGDGRIYLSEALISAQTITGARLTDPVRAVS